MSRELGAMLPALLDTLGYVGTGVTVVADRGNGLERWYANPPVASLLGYSIDELEAIPAIETIVPEQRPLVTQLSASFRAGRSVPPALEFSVIRKDGTALPIELAMGHYAIPDGLAYVMVVREITTHPQTQLSLLEADRIGLVGALAAGVAHEINTPLTPLMLNLRALRRQLTAGFSPAALPQAMRCIDDITINAERIANNVKALAALATRGPTIPLDLAAVVSSTLRVALPKIEPRAHVIRQIFPVRRVIGEESRLGQAVLAMLLFSGSGFNGELTNTSNRVIVCVEQRDNDVVLEVRDNGSTLTLQDTLHAFEPFYRSSARGAGLGVGLGIARAVAVALGGEVTLGPWPGGGAVITMRLPAAPS